MTYEKQMETYYNKDSDFINTIKMMKTADLPLSEKLASDDNNFDSKDISSCLRHIEKLKLEKGRLASELERVQTIISTYKMVEDGMKDKHRVEVDLLNKQVKAFIARNDQLSKQNDALLRRIKELETREGISTREPGQQDAFSRLAEETGKLDSDFNYLEIFIDKAEIRDKNIREKVKMTHNKDISNFQSVVTLDFMNNETITSNIVTGSSPNFNTFCRFRFKVDEFAIS
mmetsp:Transcript_57841/g.125769  ORF Transcript_57841/g.125769 Transcript_57841/m.125769 type:complete len:230 (+) Transcript_57841:1158-1847(+)